MLLVILLVVWLVALIGHCVDNLAVNRDEAEYLLGELLHSDSYVQLIHNMVDPLHDVYRGADHKDHPMLVIEKPTAESLQGMVTNLLEELEAKSLRQLLINYWSYFKTDNAIVSLFVLSNWLQVETTRKRAIFLLVGLNFLLLFFKLIFFSIYLERNDVPSS